MAKPKSSKKKDCRVIARPKTETAEVNHPRLAGKTEFVERVVDTLTSMFNRRQISQLQYGAGDRYRMAHEMTSASMGGAGDYERTRGSSGTSPTPALSYLLAAETVSEVRKRLYPKDFAIVHRVCVLGLTIEQAARQLYDETWDEPWPSYLREAGRKFRAGLDAMAEMWWPDARTMTDPVTGEEIRKMQGRVMERAGATDATLVPQSRTVVHATRDKIFYSGEKPKRARA